MNQFKEDVLTELQDIKLSAEKKASNRAKSAREKQAEK